jgi:hypothetical protein
VDLKRAVCIPTFPVNCFLHIFANSHTYSMEPAYITYCICPLLWYWRWRQHVPLEYWYLPLRWPNTHGRLCVQTHFWHPHRQNQTWCIIWTNVSVVVAVIWRSRVSSFFLVFLGHLCGKKVNTNVKHSSMSHKGHPSFCYTSGCL